MASLFKYLKELKQSKVEILTSGAIHSIEQYQNVIGSISTIDSIEEYIRDKINGIEDIDDFTAQD